MSFGRHDPPNPNPGLRYAGEIFNCRSRQKISMISRPSDPSDLHILPISFANTTFRAWNALHTYLIISADLMVVLTIGALRPTYKRFTSDIVRSSRAPTTIWLG